MIDIIHDLARLLASDAVTVDAFVRRLGPIAADHGPAAALDLRSADTRFSRVQLWRDVDTGIPAMLALDLVATARPAVADLTRAFGAYRKVIPTPEGTDTDLIFQSIAKDTATATLVARTGDHTASVDRASVVTIRLIREPRLD